MGNALRLFCKCTADPQADTPPPASASAVAALAHDLFNFQNNSQVPKGLDKHVQSSRRDQAEWYKKILVKWRKAKPPPDTAEEAARLVIEALNGVRIADVEGFLYFYGLILADVPVEYAPETSVTLPDGVKYEFQTLPVDPKAVQDGDSMTVYVSVTSDPREASNVPKEVIANAERRLKASINKKYDTANSFHNKIIEAGYRVIKIENEEILARKCRIRLRGIDAPEHKMPYADEAKVELTNLVKGKRLRILFYEQDHYGRSVGDIYCNGVFIQEVMLKRGCAWHYVTYDKRPELARWEKEARARRVGLWALPNPEMPWKWRKNNPRDKIM